MLIFVFFSKLDRSPSLFIFANQRFVLIWSSAAIWGPESLKLALIFFSANLDHLQSLFINIFECQLRSGFPKFLLLQRRFVKMSPNPKSSLEVSNDNPLTCYHVILVRSHTKGRSNSFSFAQLIGINFLECSLCSFKRRITRNMKNGLDLYFFACSFFKGDTF